MSTFASAIYTVDENGKGVTRFTTPLTTEEIHALDSRSREWVGPVNEQEKEAIVVKLQQHIDIAKLVDVPSNLQEEIVDFLAVFEAGVAPIGPVHANCIIREFTTKIQKIVQARLVRWHHYGLGNLCTHQQQQLCAHHHQQQLCTHHKKKMERENRRRRK